MKLIETTLLPADNPAAVAGAVTLLAAGSPVALPTETVYGLAADARSAGAAAAVFQAKERPFFDPLIVHLPDRAWLERLTAPPSGELALVNRLLDRFWPGPLTLLLPRRPGADGVPDLVTAGSALVAVRLSAHPVFRAVIERFGGPLAAPSANRFGRISPTTGHDVLIELAGRIPLILDAGPCAHGLESTIVLPEPGGGLRILRNGPVTAEMLAEFGPVTQGRADAVTPGQLPGHYAPRTPLRLLTADLPPTNPLTTGILGFRRDRPAARGAFPHAEYLSESGDPREAAVNFFAALRRLDAAGYEQILAEPVPETDLGRAIMERLRRATAGSQPEKGA